MNITEVMDDNKLCNCTDENSFIEISPLFIFIITIIPCGLSLICGLFFLICTIIKIFKK